MRCEMRLGHAQLGGGIVTFQVDEQLILRRDVVCEPAVPSISGVKEGCIRHVSFPS